MDTFFEVGELVSIGSCAYDVREGNTSECPLVGIGYTRLDGIKTNTQYVHWRMLERIVTVDYSAEVAKQMEGLVS